MPPLSVIHELKLRERVQQRIAAVPCGLDATPACDICQHWPRPGERALARDHCHLSGKPRGRLCHRCNLALGLFRDDPVLLRKAIAYLKRAAAAAPAAQDSVE